jgi:hypothetical protein
MAPSPEIIANIPPPNGVEVKPFSHSARRYNSIADRELNKIIYQKFF